MLIQQVIQCKVPQQALLIFLAFSDKQDGGEKLMCLMVMLFRLVMRLHKGVISDCSQGYDGLWGRAVCDSSCLVAAMLSRSWSPGGLRH